MHETPDDDRLTRFLLGDVPEAERTAIEERFLADEAFFGHLLLVEDELREAYATGALSAADRQRFEDRFLVFDDERRKVRVASALAHEVAAGSARETEVPPARRSAPPWYETLWAAFQVLNTPLRMSLAGAASLVLALLAWQVTDGMRLRTELARVTREADARQQLMAGQASGDRARAEQLAREIEDERRTRALLEQELAQRPEAVPPAGPAPRMVLSLLLRAGRTRASGETATLTIPSGAVDVRLLLERPDSPGVGRFDAVVLDADGNELWERTGISATGRLITLTIPSGLLPEGDFEVTLTGVTQSGERDRAAEYYFRVLRP